MRILEEELELGPSANGLLAHVGPACILRGEGGGRLGLGALAPAPCTLHPALPCSCQPTALLPPAAAP